ncbi:hypothetical protein [Sulfurimonas sp.]
MSKLSTIIAPIDAGIAMTNILLNARKGSVKIGNLSIPNSIKEITSVAIR